MVIGFPVAKLSKDEEGLTEDYFRLKLKKRRAN